ncbi:molybdopterin-dependent oxidoreductase [Chloroflexota bacterium]
MVGQTVVRSTCELCISGCGVLIHMKDGKPVRLEGDPDSPVNRGAMCVNGMASLEYLYHLDRLKYPLKRVGARGEGKWERITWDEALDTIATRLNETKEKHGAETVAFIRGGAKGYQDNFLQRLANVFGTPNFISVGSICHMPRIVASEITQGNAVSSDYEYPPACLVMWGLNSAESAIGEHKRIIEALNKGSKLVVIDPRETGYAKRADIWVKPRPSSDLALALGMINVIINEGLYDKEFVENWTVGFDKLKVHVQDYPPEKVAEVTWVPAETIKEVARFYANNKPASIAWGNGLDHNINNFQSARAVAILRAITGNLGKPGGDIHWSRPSTLERTSPEFQQRDALLPEMRAKRLNARDGLLPFLSYTLPQSLVKAIIEAEPYRIHNIFIQGASPLHTYTNVKELYEALNKVGFSVVADFFITPTAEIADIVLPVGTYLEIDSLHESEVSSTVGVIQKIAQVDECKSDYQMQYELAKRLGLGEHFWENDKQALDFILKPAGLTFEELRKSGIKPGTKQYKDYEKDGFSTSSKKVELYSSRLEEWGFDPLPVYHEPPESPFSDPELAKEYPLIFTSGKLAPFHHSNGHQISILRDSHPEPLVTINAGTAGKLGISEGDWVYIETKRGRIKQKASLVTSIDPRVISVEHGWWFPEREDLELHGWAESNVNILTDNKRPYAREMGSATLRGILCKIYKAA